MIFLKNLLFHNPHSSTYNPKPGFEVPVLATNIPIPLTFIEIVITITWLMALGYTNLSI